MFENNGDFDLDENIFTEEFSSNDLGIFDSPAEDKTEQLHNKSILYGKTSSVHTNGQQNDTQEDNVFKKPQLPDKTKHILSKIRGIENTSALVNNVSIKNWDNFQKKHLNIEENRTNIRRSQRIVEKSQIDVPNRQAGIEKRQISFEKKIVQRRFPGPAGLLPEIRKTVGVNNLEDGFKENCDSHNEVDNMLMCSQNSLSVFKDRQWTVMCRDFEITGFNKDCLPDKYNIKWIKLKASSKKLVNQKAPFLAAVIKTVECPKDIMPMFVLKDPTGEIQATIVYDLYEEHTNDLMIGSVIVLRDFSVLSTNNGMRHCLTITSNNLVSIYSKNSGKTLHVTPDFEIHNKTVDNQNSMILNKKFANGNLRGSREDVNVNSFIEDKPRNVASSQKYPSNCKEFHNNSRIVGSIKFKVQGSNAQAKSVYESTNSKIESQNDSNLNIKGIGDDFPFSMMNILTSPKNSLNLHGPGRSIRKFKFKAACKTDGNIKSLLAYDLCQKKSNNFLNIAQITGNSEECVKTSENSSGLTNFTCNVESVSRNASPVIKSSGVSYRNFDAPVQNFASSKNDAKAVSGVLKQTDWTSMNADCDDLNLSLEFFSDDFKLPSANEKVGFTDETYKPEFKKELVSFPTENQTLIVKKLSNAFMAASDINRVHSPVILGSCVEVKNVHKQDGLALNEESPPTKKSKTSFTEKMRSFKFKPRNMDVSDIHPSRREVIRRGIIDPCEQEDAGIKTEEQLISKTSESGFGASKIEKVPSDQENVKKKNSVVIDCSQISIISQNDEVAEILQDVFNNVDAESLFEEF